MIEEIALAADFLVRMLRNRNLSNCISEKQGEMFRMSLIASLRSRYKEHWFPEHPNRGSGYRCIRINSQMDPVILQAASSAGLQLSRVRKLIPSELTLWIDPREVSYRIGENGSICVLVDMYQPPVLEPPRESPELYLDPRLMEQPDPMEDYVMLSQY